MGNNTKTSDGGVGLCLAVLVMWAISYFFPDFKQVAPPAAEAAIAGLIMMLVQYIKPPEKQYREYVGMKAKQ